MSVYFSRISDQCGGVAGGESGTFACWVLGSRFDPGW